MMFHDDMYGHVPTGRKPLATASLVFGILSLFLCSVIYLALPLGALAVIFALLSHTEYKMASKSRAGLICGLCGILATIVVTVAAFRFVLTNPEARSYLNYYMQMYTGDADFSLEKELEEIFGGSFLQDQESQSNDLFLPEFEDEPVLPGIDLLPGQQVPPVSPEQEGGVFL